MTQPTSQQTKRGDLHYRRPMSTWWWVRKPSYFLFVMRELSSIFVAWFVVFLLVLVQAIGRGEAAYDDFLDWAGSPLIVVLNIIAAIFLVLHTVTWFSLTPQAMPPKVRGIAIPPLLVIAAQYVGLAVVSAFVYWLVTQ
jgi:succinate dehydrogenase subunit C